MSLLRNEHQATLAALHARGTELLQRYEAAADYADLDDRLRETVARIAAQRKPLVAVLAGLERATDDLPQAGNIERATLGEIGDTLSRTLGTDKALAERLFKADRHWLDDVEQALALDWSAEQAELIERLASHLRDTLRSLDASRARSDR